MKRLLLSLFSAAALLFAGAGSVLVPLPAQAQVAVDAGKTGITRGMHLLCTSAVAASVTGTTNETALATCAIPAGAMGSNGGLSIRTTWTYTNSANLKSLRVRLGGISGTAALGLGATATASAVALTNIRNRNSAASQIMGPNGNAQVGAGVLMVAGTIDTASSQDLVISGQLASAGETITLEAYEVWLLP